MGEESECDVHSDSDVEILSLSARAHARAQSDSTAATATAAAAAAAFSSSSQGGHAGAAHAVGRRAGGVGAGTSGGAAGAAGAGVGGDGSAVGGGGGGRSGGGGEGGSGESEREFPPISAPMAHVRVPGGVGVGMGGACGSWRRSSIGERRVGSWVSGEGWHVVLIVDTAEPQGMIDQLISHKVPYMYT